VSAIAVRLRSKALRINALKGIYPDFTPSGFGKRHISNRRTMPYDIEIQGFQP
jgi:hypothetical protein